MIRLYKRPFSRPAAFAAAIIFLAALSLALVAQTSRAWFGPTQENPDLIISELLITPPGAGAGDTVDIVVTFQNQGNANAAGFWVHLYVEAEDDPPTSETVPTAKFFMGIGLVADGEASWTRTDQLLTQDNPKVYAWVDPDNRIPESNEGNNLYPQPVQENPDSYEEDDTCAEATEISSDGTEQERNLFRQGGEHDADWVKFNGVANVEYEIEAIAVGEDADIVIGLHGDCDNALSFGGGAKLKFTAPATGVFYFKIEHTDENYGPENDYRLKLTGNDTCSTSLEPNDLCLLPADLAVGSGEIPHSFCERGDVDWLRFAVKAGAKYKIETENTGDRADVQMGLYTSCTDAASASGDRFEFVAPTAGFVYLKANNSDPEVFGAATDYVVSVELDGPDGCEEDVLEHDDALSSAQPVRVNGSPQRHNTCPAGDIDWVKFDAQEDETYTVETVNLAERSDTTLCRYDVNGQELECDQDGGSGHGSRLTYRSAAPGTYYFAIKQDDNKVAGALTRYDIQIITGECEDDAFEDDDEQTAAERISTDGNGQEHNVCPQNDADWVSFTADAHEKYLIQVNNIGPEADTVIELYNASGSLLARNDDYTPGIGSQIRFEPTENGDYFVKTILYNPERYGAGTEYVISIRQGELPTPTPTPSPTVTPEPEQPGEDGPPTEVRSLILVNRTRMAALHGETAAAQLMSKLNELAQHAEVRGEVIRLDNNPQISSAYAAWTANLTNVDRANQVAGAIRRLVVTYLNEREGIEYLVLAGDDRALPFRRVADNTPRQSEKSYTDVDDDHPTGAALGANFFMTDDFFADREPTPHNDQELYIPDISVGRLIETPADMISTIDKFLANPTTIVDRVLATGYDFIRDTGQQECNSWREILGDDGAVSCLVGTSWTEQELTNLQLNSEEPIKFQSISGHAAHYGEGAAAGGALTADEINQSTVDFSGGLIYTLGCHGGLNVPPSNSTSPLDLPEVFVRKGANYVGNTGFGWGMLNGIGLSEKMMRLFNHELTKQAQTPMGPALMRAKRLYFEQDQRISPYDEKVVQQLIFYGLPMRKISLETGSLGEPEDDFPGVGFDVPAPTGSFGDGEVISTTVKLDLSRVLDPEDDVAHLGLNETGSGSYRDLNGFVNADAGEPVQPLHFGSLSAEEFPPARSAVLRGGRYETSVVEDILVGTPVNEFVPRADGDEASLDMNTSWYPEVPARVRRLDDRSSLVTQIGQYDPASGRQRLYAELEIDVYYSTSSDETPPDIVVVDGLYDPLADTVAVKVGATDTSGIKDVILSFVQDKTQASTQIETTKLAYDEDTQKWLGNFPGNAQSVFYVQVVDNAGNLTTATNKGAYYSPARAREEAAKCTGAYCMFLPIMR